MRAGHFEPSEAPFTPDELEFFAEEDKITIIPKITTAQTSSSGESGFLQLLSGECGRFEPNQPVDVPLWLAVELRKRKMCTISIPPWMQLPKLREVIQLERTNMASFQPLPFFYVEIAKVLFTNAKDDIGKNYVKTRDLVTSIQDLRMNKIVQGIQQLQGPVTITLRNLSSFECNVVRHLFLKGMDAFYELSDLVDSTIDRSQQTMSQATSSAAPL